MYGENYKKVGKYKGEYNDILNISLPENDIFRSNGLYSHIKKRHPGCMKYADRIAEIIENPDYIGTNPKEPNSIEMIKKFNKNIIIAIKPDSKNRYLYVATLYEITDAKLDRQIENGRLIKMPGIQKNKRKKIKRPGTGIPAV
ncbi:MAG: hypothetical protein J1F64_08905 [Oscillospiraceae bacterium]|nr:hypothetical protein [Oscillospiraceae bacterium]